jgi:hypothetical protein
VYTPFPSQKQVTPVRNALSLGVVTRNRLLLEMHRLLQNSLHVWGNAFTRMWVHVHSSHPPFGGEKLLEASL